MSDAPDLPPSARSTQSGSSSIENPDYWWHAARNDLLRSGLGAWLGDGWGDGAGGRLGDGMGAPDLVLDVGSADAPSAAWLTGERQVSLDTDPRGLEPGHGVCASALALPFADETFDVVAAFDVIEHCAPESTAVAELARVLRPGGRLLASVPAYEWAWSDHDVRAGHHRRYTRPRLVTALETAGLRVERVTHAFTLVFPFFVAERAVRRLRGSRPAEGRLPQPSAAADRLLRSLCRVESRLLRRIDLPFGSSVLVAAVKPADGAPGVQSWTDEQTSPTS